MRIACTFLSVVAGGVLLTACAQQEPGVATCYGIAGSAGMDQCAVVRTTTVREYQINRSVDEAQFAAEVRNTCLSYGLQPGTTLYSNCLVREADARRPTSYAGHFTQAGYRYDQRGNRVDAEGFLIDRNGRRIGGRGYWIEGPGDNVVPPGTYVDDRGQPVQAQAIMAPPPRRTTYYTTTTRRTYPFANSTALGE